MRATQIVRDYFTALTLEHDLSALWELTEPATEFYGPASTIEAARRWYSRTEIAEAIALEYATWGHMFDLTLDCEELASGRVYVTSSFLAKREGWGQRADAVMISMTAVCHVRDGTIYRSSHRSNLASIWRQTAAIDEQERRRGWSDKLNPLVVAPSIAASLEAAFERWGLSPRMRGVARLIVQGRTDKEIAQDLELTTHTVRDYVKEVRRRAGVQRREDLYRAAGLWDASGESVLASTSD